MKCVCAVFAVINAFDTRQHYSVKIRDASVKIANALSFSVNVLRTMLRVENNVCAKTAKILKISTKSRKRKKSKQRTIKPSQKINKNHRKNATEFRKYLLT